MKLVHGLWAKEIDGEAQIRGALGKPRALPSVEQLSGLAREIKALTEQMNIDRLQGWLHEALSKTERGHV
jgi:hypothetical protein